MKADTSTKTSLAVGDVIPAIRKHILIGGFGLIFDPARSKGSWFYDAAGDRKLLDMYGFFGSLPLGYNHPHFDKPDVRDELRDAAMVKVANTEIATHDYARFVSTFERVAGIKTMERLFLIDGGALAVENALKAAMDWKVQKNIAAGRGEIGTEILHLRHAFHGRTGYTMSLTNTDPNKIRLFAKFDWPRVESPAMDYALPEPKRNAQAAKDEAAVETQILAAIKDRPHRICAIILEPIQCEGGDRHFRPEWFKTLRRLCDEHEMLLIYDEVQTGLATSGRTWCAEHFDVLPDLIAFGKKAQVCGVMAGPRLDEVKENVFRKPGRIASTWGSNLTDMVRSIHILEIIERDRLVENAKRMGERMLTGLHDIAGDDAMVTAARGRGLLLAFDMPDAETRDRLWKTCYEVGLLVNRCGAKTIRLRPVLDVRPEDVDKTLDLLRDALARIRQP